MTCCRIWFVKRRGGLCAVAPGGSSYRSRPVRLLYSTLLFLPLLGFDQPLSADELKFSIDDVRAALANSSRSPIAQKSIVPNDGHLSLVDPVESIGAAHSGIVASGSGSVIGHHHGMRDEDLSSLVTYVRQLDAEAPQLISASASGFHGSVYKDAAFSALREYAQQIGVEQAKPPSIDESDSARFARIDDSDVLALHQYARQIGADQPDPTLAPNIKIAEADNAFDALREFLQRGAQPESTPATPDASPKKGRPSTKPAPRPAARPTAPKYAAPTFHANFVGGKTCVLCHANQAAAFEKTLMGRISHTQPGKLDCESCHGPGSAHIQAVGCAACHGEGGITSLPGTPNLVGQDPEYLVPAMRAYVTGQRKNDLMRLIISGIGEGELHAIARYYARQPAARAQTPLIGNPKTGEHATEICASCHGEHGISIVPAWPSLAGQDAQYLANAIRAYKNGSRTKAIACASCHGEGGISREPGIQASPARTRTILFRR